MAFRAISLAACVVAVGAHRAEEYQSIVEDHSAADDGNSLMQAPAHTKLLLASIDHRNEQGDWPARVANAVDSIKFNIDDMTGHLSNISAPHLPNISVPHLHLPNISNISVPHLHMPNISSFPNISVPHLHLPNISMPHLPNVSRHAAAEAERSEQEVAATESEGTPAAAAPATPGTMPSHYGGTGNAQGPRSPPRLPKHRHHVVSQEPQAAPVAEDVVDEVIEEMVEDALKEEAIAEAAEGLPASAASEMDVSEEDKEALEEILEEALQDDEEIVDKAPKDDLSVGAEAARPVVQQTEVAEDESNSYALPPGVEAIVSGPAFEEAGLDVDIEEPLWEIESRVALAAMALGGISGSDDTVNLASSVFASVRNSTAVAVRSAVANVTSSVRNRTSNALDTVRNSTANALDSVKNSTANALDTVRNTTAGVIDDVRTANVSNVFDSVRNSTANVVQNVQNRTADVINRTADVIADVSDVLQNVSLGNLTSDMVSVARDTAADIFENINVLLDAIGPFLTPELAKRHGMLMRVEDIAEATGVRGEEAAKAANVFQGDMVPESDSQLELFQSITSGKRGAHVAAGKPWTGGIVKFCFASDVGADVRGHFLAAVDQAERATCLQFQDVGWQFGDSTTDTADQRCNEQPAVFVMSRPDYGCYSVVGESHKPSQQLQLQHPGCTTQGVILHEIGHALGMAHEHARPDRDQYIKVNWDNIQPEWTSAFNITQDGHVDLPYEYLSLMHYDPYAFSKENHLPTIQAEGRHNSDIGQRNGFADADIQQLILMYEDEVPGCTGNEIQGTGCVNMPGDDGSDICTGLTACGGIQNERCCACNGGVEVQCYEGETCPNTPQIERTSLIGCINDVTEMFAAHEQKSPDNPCIIHNTCDMELKFKCRETCTHSVAAGAYQADFCHELPATDICDPNFRLEWCEVWDPLVVAQFDDSVAQDPDIDESDEASSNESTNVADPDIDESDEASSDESTNVADPDIDESDKASSDESTNVADPDIDESDEASSDESTSAADIAGPDVQQTEVEDVAEAESSTFSRPNTITVEDEANGEVSAQEPEKANEEEAMNEAEAKEEEEAKEDEAAKTAEEILQEAEEALVDAEKAVTDAQEAYKVSKHAVEGAEEMVATAHQAVQPDPTTGACPRPSYWCTHAGSVFDDSRDCDGDGIADPFCYDELEQFGFYSSVTGCESTWPQGACDLDKARVDALKAQREARILRNVAVVSGVFSVVLAGLTVHSYWAAAGAAAVAA